MAGCPSSPPAGLSLGAAGVPDLAAGGVGADAGGHLPRAHAGAHPDEVHLHQSIRVRGWGAPGGPPCIPLPSLASTFCPVAQAQATGRSSPTLDRHVGGHKQGEAWPCQLPWQPFEKQAVNETSERSSFGESPSSPCPARVSSGLSRFPRSKLKWDVCFCTLQQLLDLQAHLPPAAKLGRPY